MIHASGISKRYGAVEALNGISLDIDAGERFGLIGPDGSGKTTLIRILTSLIVPDEGQATVHGFDVVRDHKSLRKVFGYMPGRFSLYQDLSIAENIAFFASVFGADLEPALERVRPIYAHIEPFKDRRAGQLSGGMKQKLALCCALIHNPRLLFLDEPTTGVDAVSRREFWDMLDQFQADGLTVVVCTPYMDEASRCGRIAFMKGGKVIATDTPSDMTRRFRHQLWSLRSDHRHLLLNALDGMPGVRSAWPFGETMHVALEDGVGIDSVLERIGPDVSARRTEPGIEDVFMELSR